MNIFTQFFKKKDNPVDRRQFIEQDLMRREVALTQDIFGAVPKGGRRDFFCLDKHTWIWYEEWVDNAGAKQSITTRYMIRSTEIVKSQNGGAYHRLTLKEAKNFQKATKAYLTKVSAGLYEKTSNPQPAKA